ncbi:hypothetical protein LLG96_06615 [bacterium]|nr:hypothetical protein [bacterium]
MHKRKFENRIVLCEIIGFTIAVFMLFADEVFDLPHYLLGAPATPINWVESFMESGFVIVLAIITISNSCCNLNKIKYLEGFLPVCSFCKKIKTGDTWIPIEEYISKNSNAVFSHGFCPECAKKYYGQYMQKEDNFVAGDLKEQARKSKESTLKEGGFLF